MGDFVFDAHRVGPKLWVGSCPIFWVDLRNTSTEVDIPTLQMFDLVVLCAQELQEISLGRPTMQVPLMDAKITQEDYRRALRAAKQVSRLRQRGKRILLTCQMGINRSSLVAAMSLMLLDGFPAEAAVLQIQRLRKPAFIRMKPLKNASFVQALHVLEESLNKETVV